MNKRAIFSFLQHHLNAAKFRGLLQYTFGMKKSHAILLSGIYESVVHSVIY